MDRSENMARIGSKNTKPERKVEALLKTLHLYPKRHDRKLPGCPDFVFVRKKKIIFVSGCFWHQHGCKRSGHLPLTNAAFWRAKLEGNKKRDKKNQALLRAAGWSVLVIWECDLKEEEKVLNTIKDFLA